MMYRIVLLDNDQIEIQAFADLTNDTAEDWKEIKLKLVANDLQIVKKTENKSNNKQQSNIVLQQNQISRNQQLISRPQQRMRQNVNMKRSNMERQNISYTEEEEYDQG